MPVLLTRSGPSLSACVLVSELFRSAEYICHLLTRPLPSHFLHVEEMNSPSRLYWWDDSETSYFDFVLRTAIFACSGQMSGLLTLKIHSLILLFVRFMNDL